MNVAVDLADFEAIDHSVIYLGVELERKEWCKWVIYGDDGEIEEVVAIIGYCNREILRFKVNKELRCARVLWPYKFLVRKKVSG